MSNAFPIIAPNSILNNTPMDFLEHNSLYVVAIIAAVIWLGLFVFMFSVEKRVRRLEKETKNFAANSDRNVA